MQSLYIEMPIFSDLRDLYIIRNYVIEVRWCVLCLTSRACIQHRARTALSNPATTAALEGRVQEAKLARGASSGGWYS